ncbi:unnamed protein product [Mytilus coruscus]|uniref:Uncharacterized protein n=1 Tax=Mytilus coruscus TaxID=42192 RepID=A0A6J7ZV54_MYTCO|nr:unnamed protein product [Mytilus coruscus]
MTSCSFSSSVGGANISCGPNTKESQSSCFTDSQGSIWTPSSSQDLTSKKRKALENFLEVCGLSPVKKYLSCTWSEASDRTKTDYVKKSRKIFNEVLNVLAPNQEESIANVLFASNNSNDDVNILDIISSAYNLTPIWGTQRQLLSIIANKFTLAEIHVYIPDLTKYRFTAARKHALSIGHGQPISICQEYREALTEMQISLFLDFAMSPAIMTDVPFGEMQLKLKSGEKITVPKVILNSIGNRVVEQYQQYCIENEFSAFASYRSYMRIISAIEPNIRKCMKGLDNYAADGSKAFEDLQKIIDQLGSIGKDKDWCEELKKSLSSSKQYLKLEYKLHVSKSSKVMDHCSQYALSTDSKEFAKDCNHVHDQDCLSCEVLQHALLKISDAVTSQETYETDDQKDEILYIVNQSKKAIQEWKMHILRTFNQDLARSDAMENLGDEEILIERDWIMKFVPMMYGEFAHFRQCNTGCHNFQRNPCFHGYKSIFGIQTLNTASHIKIERLDFGDPQGGKSICDRRAAHIKSAVRKYVNEGHDVRSADEFLHAVKTKNMTNISVIVALPPSSQKDTASHSTLLKNIMSVNNVLYRTSNMRVWRQYGIGEGKFIKKVPESQKGTYPELQAVQVYEGQINARKEKSSRHCPETTLQMSADSSNTTKTTMVEEDVSENGGLFSCPEEFC